MLTPQNSFACTEIINSNGLLFFSILIFSYTIQVPDSYREVSSSFSFLQNKSVRYLLPLTTDTPEKIEGLTGKDVFAGRG